MRVLVTDANNRVALAVVRALGRAGRKVWAVEQERYARGAAAFASRYVRRTGVISSYENGTIAEDLARWGREVDVVLPVSTNAVLAVARHRDRIAAKVPLPPLEVIRRANDKGSVIEAARRAGVPVPGTEPAGFPRVVKLQSDEGTYLSPAQRYRIVRNAQEQEKAVRELSAIRPVVVQEFIPGEGYGVGVLLGEEVHAVFCHRRLREYPVSGGPSTMCESVAAPGLADLAVRLLRELEWRGVAMVEFRRDDRDGAYRLMEVNPRFWGTLPLAVRSGINFPDLLCRWAFGERLGPPPRYRAGVRMRFLPLDILAVLDAFRTGRRRARYLGGFVRDLFDPAVGDGLFDPCDLGASLAYLLSRK